MGGEKGNLDSTKTTGHSSSSSSSAWGQSSVDDKDRDEDTCRDVSFADCEQAILRMAVKRAKRRQGRRLVHDPEVQRMVRVVEAFLRERRLICYGGTAINRLLPPADRFYDDDSDMPDYDAFSEHALEDAKALADRFAQEGFRHVTAKAGQHLDTYKVFVDFVPIVDLTWLPPGIYRRLAEDAVERDGLRYAPPDFLRMSMYGELSRPAGDVERWEKVQQRLQLLNKHHELGLNVDCDDVAFQRRMDGATARLDARIYRAVRDVLLEHKVVFFGGFAHVLYSQYMPRAAKLKLRHVSDFEVLAKHPAEVAQQVSSALSFVSPTVVQHEAVGELVPAHWEVRVGNDAVLFVFEPVGCHSYNSVSLRVDRRRDPVEVRVASIDTMLSLYLAFMYADHPYFAQFRDRLRCMCKLLFDVQQRNRLAQTGLLRRFSVKCYGRQPGLRDIRAARADKLRALRRTRRNHPDRERWFLHYDPKTVRSAATTTKGQGAGTKKRGTRSRRPR